MMYAYNVLFIILCVSVLILLRLILLWLLYYRPSNVLYLITTEESREP